jgi:hypothetical protein
MSGYTPARAWKSATRTAPVGFTGDRKSNRNRIA